MATDTEKDGRKYPWAKNVNKTDKCFAGLTRKKAESIDMLKSDIKTTTTKIQRVWDWLNINIIEEKDKFLETYNFLEWNEEEIKYPNRWKISSKTKSVGRSLPWRWSPLLYGFNIDCHKMFTENIKSS